MRRATASSSNAAGLEDVPLGKDLVISNSVSRKVDTEEVEDGPRSARRLMTPIPRFWPAGDSCSAIPADEEEEVEFPRLLYWLMEDDICSSLDWLIDWRWKTTLVEKGWNDIK